MSQTYEVILETVEAEPMAAVSARANFAGLSRAIPSGLDKVYAVLRAGQVEPLGCNVVFYLPFDDKADFDLRIGVRLATPFAATDEVKLFETPAGLVAHVVYFGDYGHMKPAHDAIHQWVSAQGHKLTGASWEVYGDWSDDPTQLRTDIYYQLKGDARG